MKRLILLFLLFLFVLPCFAMELKTFDIRETYFNKEYKSVPKAGKLVSELDYFSFKGVWEDAKKLANSVMYEELFCDIYSNICSSSIVIIDFLGTDFAQLNPYLDVFSLQYKIIDKKGSIYKLYSPITEYTIEADIANKKATKYKVFSNGDINKYFLNLDSDKASGYFKTFIP